MIVELNYDCDLWEFTHTVLIKKLDVKMSEYVLFMPIIHCEIEIENKSFLFEKYFKVVERHFDQTTNQQVYTKKDFEHVFGLDSLEREKYLWKHHYTEVYGFVYERVQELVWGSNKKISNGRGNVYKY
jgi:hypothetical protein